MIKVYLCIYNKNSDIDGEGDFSAEIELPFLLNVGDRLSLNDSTILRPCYDAYAKEFKELIYGPTIFRVVERLFHFHQDTTQNVYYISIKAEI